MTNSSTAGTLLDQVQRRMRLASFARALYWCSCGALGLGVAGLLTARLLGLAAPVDQRPEWLAAAAVVVLLLAGLCHRRVARIQAARRIDRHAETRDLFLTLATLSTSAGEYQPLVEHAAEEAARRIAPPAVVPFRLARPLAVLSSWAVLLGVLAWTVPQLDPFGHVEAAVKKEAEQKEIVAIRKATRARQDQLKQDTAKEDEESEQIDKQIAGLKSAFREMKPREQQKNSKVLQSQRNALNDQWKMVSSEDLRKMLSQQGLNQQFGGARGQKMNEWLKELQEGRTQALQKEMEQARETVQAMLEAKTPEERRKLASDLRRQLQDIKKFSSEKAGSKELAAALDKALKALEAAEKSTKSGESGGETNEEMSQEAMQALQESLALSKSELQELARSAGDLKKLEEALQTLQKAESLNQQGQLDGEQCEGCRTLAEYAEKYRQMMAGKPGGDGEGMGNPGFGKGGEAPENDSDPEGYQDEKSKSLVQAGKILLSIRTKEYAGEKDFDPNELRQYQDTVTAIKSGVQAAIESEQVPPGYVDGIKGYFDKLEPTGGPAK